MQPIQKLTNMNDLQKIKIARNKLDKKKDLCVPRGYASLPQRSLTFFPPFYKRKASFILCAARVRKRNQNDASTLV